jgi:hypothetical protein
LGREVDPEDHHSLLQGALEQPHRARSDMGEGIRHEGEIPSYLRIGGNFLISGTRFCERGVL